MSCFYHQYKYTSNTWWSPKVIYDTCKAYVSSICLKLFQGWLLRVNWGKSCLFPINEVPQFQELVGTLGCRVDQLPTTYLGVPFGSKHKALEIWDGISVKTEKKLTRWRAQYLSLGGRLILINSVLDSLRTCMMSLSPILTKWWKNWTT